MAFLTAKARTATPVAKARMTALATQDEFAELFGVTVQTICKWEQSPDEWMTPAKLRVYYENVGQDGKKMLRDYAASFFAQCG